MPRHYRSQQRRNSRNEEALTFEWDPRDCNRYLGPDANPHFHPKLAELVQRWWMEGDETDDIDRKSRNAYRRIFRDGANRPNNRGNYNNRNHNQNRNSNRPQKSNDRNNS